MTASGAEPRKVHFGGDAAAQTAFADMAKKDFRAALGQARWAVRTAPIEPPAPSALGSASLAIGRSHQAYAAFVVAGSMGWRDIPTQLYWLTQGVAAGNVGVAKERLDALLRMNVDGDAIVSSLSVLEQAPTGRSALASLLSENPPWESRILAQTGGLHGDHLNNRMATIELAAARGITFDCAAIGAAASQLIRHNRVVDARTLWRRACDRSGDIYLFDGTFETDPAVLLEGPFDWRLQSRAGLDVDIAPAPAPLKGHALRVASSITVRTIAARQLAALGPGRYRLSWQTSLDSGKPDESITVLIDCNGSASVDMDRVALSVAEANLVTRTFSVPGKGCPIQAIDVLKAASASGNTQTGWIDNIEIEPF